MTEQDNPFSRWSRLKQESRAVKETEATPPGAELPAKESSADTTSDEPFDLASLPSIDSIAADTDIIAFLRAGVPPELTRAALRKAWTSDPAIRDFIGIAENQWDFNDPGAIPGFGPLELTENAAEILSQVSSRLGSIPDALAITPIETEHTDALVSEKTAANPPLAPSEPPSTIADAPSNKMRDARAEDSPAHPAERDDVFSKLRRHGGALPQ